NLFRAKTLNENTTAASPLFFMYNDAILTYQPQIDQLAPLVGTEIPKSSNIFHSGTQLPLCNAQAVQSDPQAPVHVLFLNNLLPQNTGAVSTMPLNWMNADFHLGVQQPQIDSSRHISFCEQF
ncbi:hypothetical protein PMAYCL1PPCAC_21358, partial [Pristionchus mayeri]